MRYLFLIRAHHWVKNFFLFAPAFFAGEILQLGKLELLVAGFVCFSLASSSVYILNDILDCASDRQHPVKKHRPIPSGKISRSFAIGTMIVLFLAGLAGGLLLKVSFAVMILLYVFLNVAYSGGLKRIPLVDVFLISAGFLIRTVSGGILADVHISRWLIIMIFLLSLLMAFAKRRDDILLAHRSGNQIRVSCSQYNIDYINICLSLVSGVIMVSYLMYTFSDDVQNRIGENSLYITSLFVFAGLLRYLQITLVNENSGSPTRIFLTDRIIQVTVAGWIFTFFTTLYVI